MFPLEKISRGFSRAICSLHRSSSLLPVHQSCDHVCFHLLSSPADYNVNRSTPETFDIVTKTVDVSSRKNLAQISRILTQITSGVEFGDDKPAYVPINDYVRKAISQMSAWLLEGTFSYARCYHSKLTMLMSIVADVPNAETQFQAHEFLDVTVQPKPIYISPNEVYAMHTLLSQHQEHLVSAFPNASVLCI